jgi:hypothetical protein
MMKGEIPSFFMSKITKKTFDDYGNEFRAGRKNIDDLYTKMIDDLAAASREESKFQYVMKDVFEVMRSLGWTGDDTFEVNVGGCSATGTATHPDANPKWAKPYGTVTYQSDAFIVIKNANKNPVVPSQALQLPEGKGKPVVVD